MTKIGTVKVLRKRLFKGFGPIVAVAALASAMLFAGTVALILPQQSPVAPHRFTRTVQAGPLQKHKVFGVTVVQTISPIGSAHPQQPPFAPRLLQQQPSALWLGPGNNNNDGNGGGGARNMDPGLKLLICILIDFIGVASFAAPGLGEATDVGWAPISALLVNYLFGNGVFTALALVEELSPGFDVIPTATIAWFVENGNNEESSSTSEAGAAPQSRDATQPPRSSPPQSKNRKSAESDVIDVDIID